MSPNYSKPTQLKELMIQRTASVQFAASIDFPYMNLYKMLLLK